MSQKQNFFPSPEPSGQDPSQQRRHEVRKCRAGKNKKDTWGKVKTISLGRKRYLSGKCHLVWERVASQGNIRASSFLAFSPPPNKAARPKFPSGDAGGVSSPLFAERRGSKKLMNFAPSSIFPPRGLFPLFLAQPTGVLVYCSQFNGTGLRSPDVVSPVFFELSPRSLHPNCIFPLWWEDECTIV